MTPVLDIDVGNTRIKWRSNDDRRGAFMRSEGWLDPSWQKRLEPSRIRISSVAGREANNELRNALARRFAAPVEFARPVRHRAGVTSAYRVPSQMGVDRWLCLLAAWKLVQGSFVVVGVGTAATLDFVDHTGLHRGGYIVPGLRSLVRALGVATAQVQVKVGVGRVLEALNPGADTAECVNRGSTQMLLDFVEQSIARYLKDDEHGASIVLTGGDAETVSAHLRRPHRWVPELVLDGLAVALP